MNGENFTDLLDAYLDARVRYQNVEDFPASYSNIEQHEIKQRYEESKRMLNNLINRILKRLLASE